MLDPVTARTQKEIDSDFNKLLKELRTIYLDHSRAQADYQFNKNLLDKDINVSSEKKMEALSKMQNAFAQFKQKDKEYSLLKAQIERWSKDCENLTKTLPNLKCYSFNDLFSKIF